MTIYKGDLENSRGSRFRAFSLLSVQLSFLSLRLSPEHLKDAHKALRLQVPILIGLLSQRASHQQPDAIANTLALTFSPGSPAPIFWLFTDPISSCCIFNQSHPLCIHFIHFSLPSVHHYNRSLGYVSMP